ncbi:uncharacterized protein AB675_419 [Cyphellophora attinorum]|uniref:Uncharacterized protein n=1 Tax=Cyphellophora attinorum TaxID=1664694 RepID=A0A0N0NS39_9EURO|nr:uncharacterized protein AB675_419 [Phialophora attinorum]KPI45811.1 hypothetical protein AB675_419 [Phialophora attinorum]
MINWSKFADPHNNESAHFSDLIYPPDQTNVRAVGTFDHVGRLLNSDLLGNAGDRRFAISQDSAIRHSYDFYTSKLDQIQGAIDTLDRYIEAHGPVGCDATMSAPPTDYIRRDVVGMGPVPAVLDRLPDFRISPAPILRPAAMQSPAYTSLASPSTASTVGSQRSSHISRASTSLTSISSTRVSIADLLNAPPEAKTPAEDVLSPDLSHSSMTSHRPSQALVDSTLDNIRSARGIIRPHSGESREKRLSSLPVVSHHDADRSPVLKGRSFRAARMRRYSKTRERKEAMSDPLPVAVLDRVPKPSTLIHTQVDGRSNTDLGQWYDGMPRRRSPSHDANAPSRSQQALLMAGQISGADDRDTQSDAGPVRGRRHSPMSSRGLTIDVDLSSDPSADAYAYNLEKGDVNPSRHTAYGYIAGDARPSFTSIYGTGAAAARQKLRGRPRERSKGSSGKSGSRQTARDTRKNAETDDSYLPSSSPADDSGPSKESALERSAGVKRSRSVASSPDLRADRKLLSAELVKRWTQTTVPESSADHPSPLDELLRDPESDHASRHKRRKVNPKSGLTSSAGFEDLDDRERAELAAAQALVAKWHTPSSSS